MTFADVLSSIRKHWRADRAETPLGGLMPMGVHAIDAMIDLCGPIDHVFAPDLPPRRADRRRRHHLDPAAHEGGPVRLSRHHDYDRARLQFSGLRLERLAAARRRDARGRRLIRGAAHAAVRHLQVSAGKGRGQSLAGGDASISPGSRWKPSPRRPRADRPIRSPSTRWSRAWPRPRPSCARPPRARSRRCSDEGWAFPDAEALGRRKP